MDENKKKRVGDWIFLALCIIVVILFICQKVLWDK